MNSSRNKIFVIIVILGVTASGLFYWSATNYAEVKDSLERLTAPHEEAVALNAVFRNLVEAESDFNSYIITDNSAFLESYEGKMTTIDSTLMKLESMLDDDPEQQVGLDSLRSVIGQKEEYLQLLYKLKREQKRNVFSKKALDRIERQIGDSTFVERELLQKRELTTSIDTVEETSTVLTPIDQEGIKGFFNRVFGKQKTRLDTVTNLKEKVNSSIQLSVDTNVVREYMADSTLSAVKDILLNVLVEELTVRKSLKTTEMSLIERDREFFENIKNIISAITREEEKRNQARRSLALVKVTTLTERFYLIGGLGIIFSAIFLYLLLRDLTKASHYRRKLEVQKVKAEKMAEEKENFLAKMSHEIRTPLHNIIGFSDLLSTPDLTEIQRKYLSGIRQSNIYLKELIDNILESAKMNQKNAVLEKSQVYIPDLASEIEQVFEYKFLDKAVEFLVQVAPVFNDKVLLIDVLKLKQVLVNLIGNALKFTDSGYVKVGFDLNLNEEVAECIISVEDSGKGIGEEEQLNVFEQFSQGKSSQNIGLSGTGLGLYITTEIVERFNGRIELDSKKGMGSIFTFRFPVEYEESTREPEQLSEETTTDEARTSTYFDIDVIAVEDDTWNARLLEESLIRNVRSLKIFHSAEEALEFFSKEGNADLIFTDINLPGMSGSDLLLKLSERGITIPVVAVSAHIQQAARMEILDAGFDRVCFKPFTKAELVSLIGEIFAQKATAPNEVDVSFIRLFTGDDEEEFESVLSFFHEGLLAKYEAFKTASLDRDLSTIGMLSHQLKTAVDQLGRKDLSESLAGLELLVEMKKETRAWEEVQNIIPLLYELTESVGEIRSQCRSL